MGDDCEIGILGAARFVVGGRIQRDERIVDPSRARAALDTFLQAAEELEPTEEEVRLATELEELALKIDAPMDSGESLLCAIVAVRSFSLLITGDKRAIEAAEKLASVSNLLTALAAKFLCLEQLMHRILKLFGASEVRIHVCSEPQVDIALCMCFRCRSLEITDVDPAEGLNSYIRSVREVAPTMLHSDE